MKIEFYYWDMQCPINNEMLRLLEKYSKYFEITLYNVKDNFEIAKKQRLFFPTLTVVNGVNRYFSPISDKYDYKSAPLKALEEYLKDKYSKIIAISDEVGTFPNGDLKWFLDNGFRDEGVISYEPGYCRLHLVSKII